MWKNYTISFRCGGNTTPSLKVDSPRSRSRQEVNPKWPQGYSILKVDPAPIASPWGPWELNSTPGAESGPRGPWEPESGSWDWSVGTGAPGSWNLPPGAGIWAPGAGIWPPGAGIRPLGAPGSRNLTPGASGSWNLAPGSPWELESGPRKLESGFWGPWELESAGIWAQEAPGSWNLLESGPGEPLGAGICWNLGPGSPWELESGPRGPSWDRAAKGPWELESGFWGPQQLQSGPGELCRMRLATVGGVGVSGVGPCNRGIAAGSISNENAACVFWTPVDLLSMAET